MEGVARNQQSVTNVAVSRPDFRTGRPLLSTRREPLSKLFSRRPPPEESAEETFRKFLCGEHGAFERLFEQYNAKLFRYCYKLVRDQAAAEDLTEDMWLKLIESRTRLTDKENVLAFLYHVLHNLTLNYLRSARMQMSTSIDSAKEEIELNQLTEVEETLLDCLEHLSFDSKELLILHYYGGFSFKEIAEAWHMEPEAIWTRATRARQQLKALIDLRQKSQ